MRYSDLVSHLHSRIQIARNLKHYIQTDLFQHTYNNATVEEKLKVDQLIMEIMVGKHSQKPLEQWVRKQEKDLGLYSVRELRTEAQILGIKGYNFLPKQTLLSLISQMRVINATRQSANSNRELAERNGTTHNGEWGNDNGYPCGTIERAVDNISGMVVASSIRGVS